jgi:hypothetical protein
MDFQKAQEALVHRREGESVQISWLRWIEVHGAVR